MKRRRLWDEESTLTVRMSAKQHGKLADWAHVHRTTSSEIVRRLVDDFLASEQVRLTRRSS